MKKLLTLTAVGVILTAPATAVQKCVALNANNTTCSSVPSDWSGKADWETSCMPDPDTTIPIKGIAACSNTAVPGVTTATTLSTVSTSSSTDNTSCWCKMTSPAVSSWVFASASVGNCAYNCAYNCAANVMYTPEFRSAMFSTMAD